MNEKPSGAKYSEPSYSEKFLCIKCGKGLKNLDIALHKKMINRGATQWMCIDCLAEYTGVSTEELIKKAEYFKKQGCTLF